MITLIILLYLVGYVLAYYMMRYNYKSEKGAYNYSYRRVIEQLGKALFSWFAVIIIGCLLLTEVINDFLFKLNDREPPKWL